MSEQKCSVGTSDKREKQQRIDRGGITENEFDGNREQRVQQRERVENKTRTYRIENQIGMKGIRAEIEDRMLEPPKIPNEGVLIERPSPTPRHVVAELQSQRQRHHERDDEVEREDDELFFCQGLSRICHVSYGESETLLRAPKGRSNLGSR